MSFRVMRFEGCYNLAAPTEKQAQWVIYLPDDAPSKTISQTVELGGPNDPEGEDDPFEVVEFLENHIDGLWFSSSREKQKEAIQWMRDHKQRLRVEWCDSKIIATLKDIGRLQDEIKKYHNEIMYVIDEMEGASE